jgi:hypothetical protein
MKKIPLILLLTSVLMISLSSFSHADNLSLTQRSALVKTDDWVLKQAFAQKKSGLQVCGRGVVTKLLSDDVTGDRHQRFILRLTSGQTLLIAHNIDIAPRVLRLKIGASVSFYGQYEWNTQGGVVHWTHHDPAKKHLNGWLKYNNKVYQ